MTLPAPFLLAPNWATPVVLTSAWKTDVLSGENGTEQRVSLRDTPADTMKYSAAILSQADAGALARILAQAPTGRFHVPRWFDTTLLTANVTIGATTVTCDTTDRGFTVGGSALLWRRATGVYEVRAISAIASGALTTDATTSAWSGNTDVEVLPIAPAWLTLPLTRTYVGGELAEVAVACEWELPLPTTGATMSVATGVTIISDASVGSVIAYINIFFAGSYLIVYAQVADADGVPIPEATVTWALTDAVNWSIQPVGPFGQVAILRDVTGAGTTATLTATSGAASGSRTVSV